MTRLVPALARGLDILELLAERGSTGAPEISVALGLPRTTVHELIKTLAARDYVQTVEANGPRYRLGLKLFELGAAYESGLDLARVGHREAELVAGKCGETTHVAIPDGTDVVYIVKVDSTHAVQMVSAVGRRIPAHLTAVGKAILAYTSAEDLDTLYPKGQTLLRMTPTSVGTAEKLKKVLAQVRAEGRAWDQCESNPDVYCVAAPVRDRTGNVVAGMSISVPVNRWSEKRALELADIIVEGAQSLSRNLGASLQQLTG